MKKSKIFKTLAVFGACLTAPLLLTGCQTGDNGLLEFRVQDGYVQYTKDGENWENIFATDEINAGKDGNGIKSITIDQANSDATKTTYIITFDNNTTYSFEVINGTNGKDGENGKGIVSIEIDFANSNETMTMYIITFDDDTTYSYSVMNGVDGTNGEDGADGSVVTIGEDGYWYIDGVKTDVKARGEDGTDGTNGTDGKDGNGIKSITIDQANSDSTKTTYIITFDDNSTYTYEVKNGTNGINGEDGADGSVVTIGEDGYWYIDGVKTDVKARGEDGTDGTNGTNGADGINGTDGFTPFIGENGNWWIDKTDTGVVAKHEDVTITLKYDSSIRFSEDTIVREMVDRYNYKSTIKCPYGESLTLPIPENIFGYEFEGWYSTIDGVITANDSKVTNLTNFTKDITIVPKFKGYESEHSITSEGVIYHYEGYTNVNKITFTGEDTGVIKIPYGTQGVFLDSSSVLENEEYTLSIPETIFDSANIIFNDRDYDFETSTWTSVISAKVKTLNIKCETANSEFEILTMGYFSNITDVCVEGIVTSVYVGVFKNFTSLSSLTDSTSERVDKQGLVELNKCSYIGESAFENSSIECVVMDFECSERCYIGAKAFKDCSNLYEVSFGNESGESINTSSDIFYGCTKLNVIGIKNVDVDITLPATSFANAQWNMYDGYNSLLESDVTQILKNQEYRVYRNQTNS